MLRGLVLWIVVLGAFQVAALEDANIPGTITPPNIDSTSANAGAGDGFSALTHNETTSPADATSDQAADVVEPSEAPSVPSPSPVLPITTTVPPLTPSPSAQATEAPSPSPVPPPSSVPSPTPVPGPNIVEPSIEPTQAPARPTPQPTTAEPESPPPPQSAIPQPAAASPVPSSPAPTVEDKSPAPPVSTGDHHNTPAPTPTPTSSTSKPLTTSPPPTSVRPPSDGSNNTDSTITASPRLPVPSPTASSASLAPKEGPATTAPPSANNTPLAPASASESPTADSTTKPPSTVDEEADQLKDPSGQGRATQKGAKDAGETANFRSVVSILGVVFGAAGVLVLTLCVVHTRRIRRGGEPDTPVA